MMKAEPLPPDASVASTGLGIRYVGEHAWAASGEVTVTAGTSPITMLDFTTGSGYIIANIDFTLDQTNLSASAKWGWLIKLNDQTVLNYLTEVASTRGNNDVDATKLLIPPFTRFVAQCQSPDDANDVDFTVTMAGRVYGAIE
tara:strand:- start:296 stop:724 length:429 start_codon:yes stop_codon:yes gene_type:complete